jgi:HNH endonuclease
MSATTDARCERCGKAFRAKIASIKLGQGRFCSKSCAAFSIKRPTEEERFWAKVSKTDSCWLWTGWKIDAGYGFFRTGDCDVLAHRYAYELLVGPILEGLTIDHVKTRGCSSRACVNPAHLEAVTMRENTLRGDGPAALNARKTHCPRGHELVAENLSRWHSKRGRRRCLQCHRERESARRMVLRNRRILA